VKTDNEELNYDVLKRRMQLVKENEDAGQEMSDSHGEEDLFEGLTALYVLLVRPNSVREGMYTLQINKKEVVLAFELEEDAQRYATLLEAQDFPHTTVEAFHPTAIRDFCLEAKYQLGWIQPGSVFMPPEESLVDASWFKKTSKKAEDDTEKELEEVRSKLDKLFGEGPGASSKGR